MLLYNENSSLKRFYFCQKTLIFSKKLLTSAKLRESWYPKNIFSETTYVSVEPFLRTLKKITQIRVKFINFATCFI